ncbi:putative serine/threonine-protein kinase [Arachis hypogaea]|nr:putative serine/threonine-protein kinase [Arachis hypogaea]
MVIDDIYVDLLSFLSFLSLGGYISCRSASIKINALKAGDIKGSNLLIDNDGVLKIADFGLASFFDPHHKHPMTSRVVTLWYRPPELLLRATEYGVGVDLWSAGCILAELLAKKPIMPGRTKNKSIAECGSLANFSQELQKLEEYRMNQKSIDSMNWKLEALLAVVNNNDTSHIVHVLAGTNALSDVLISIPIFTGDGEGGSGFAAAAAGGVYRQEAAAKKAAEEASKQEKGGEQQAISQDATMTERASASASEAHVDQIPGKGISICSASPNDNHLQPQSQETANPMIPGEELFIHQFCDAHTCSGKQKPFSRGGKEQSSFFRLAAGALILVLLPVFYLFLYLVQSDMKGQTQELCRISKAGWKVKPS